MIHTFACISKKFQILLTINQRVCLAQDERIQKQRKEKECFLGWVAGRMMTIWQENFQNAAMIHTFACISKKGPEHPNNQPKSLPGARWKNTKRRKRKNVFQWVSWMIVTIWQENFHNAAIIHTFGPKKVPEPPTNQPKCLPGTRW